MSQKVSWFPMEGNSEGQNHQVLSQGEELKLSLFRLLAARALEKRLASVGSLRGVWQREAYRASLPLAALDREALACQAAWVDKAIHTRVALDKGKVGVAFRTGPSLRSDMPGANTDGRNMDGDTGGNTKEKKVHEVPTDSQSTCLDSKTCPGACDNVGLEAVDGQPAYYLAIEPQPPPVLRPYTHLVPPHLGCTVLLGMNTHPGSEGWGLQMEHPGLASSRLPMSL